jgi:hypothetical protein
MDYATYVIIDSPSAAGVRYTIRKVSFGRRVELTRRIRELASRKEFLEGGDTPQDKMDAALLGSEIDRIYVLWGLKEVTGLQLDGVCATPESFAETGPEALFREALHAIKEQCGLSDVERKN